MIQRLRRKFIATNMFLVSLVLLAVFSIQTFSAYQHAREQIYQAQLMALRGITHTSAPGFEFSKAPPGGEKRPKDAFPAVPIFAAEVSKDGTLISLQAGPGATVSAETAQALIDLAFSQSSDRGKLSDQNLSFLYRQEDGRHFLAFADDRLIASTIRSQLLTSLLICGLSLLVFFLISRFLAKLSLRPAEKVWEQQRQFVADASHELKTPITVILANTDIVLSHPTDSVEGQAKWIRYIQDEATRMKYLVDDLLFLAKSDAARTPLHPETVPLDQLVVGSLLPFESVAFEAGVTLAENIAPGLFTQGDPKQLRRLVVILLDNAVKYAGEQGTVTVCLDRFQDKPRLQINNTGPAISPEHLPHLFERFYRADTARDRTQGGYGLGLSIAKSIAEAHGGKITVASSVEAGITFTVTFPKK